MILRNGSLAALLLLLALLTGAAVAQEPPAPSYEGTFKNDDVTITLKKSGDIDYTGTITASGQEMPIEGAGVKGGQLSGRFKTEDGEKYTFFAVFKDGKLELTSDDVVQLLEAVTAKPNPLAKPKSPNPLSRGGDVPAKPKSGSVPSVGGEPPADAPVPKKNLPDDPADMPAIRDASAAMDKSDYAKAWAILKPLAERGNVRALFLEGLMYQNGHGIPAVDGAKAIDAYERSGRGGFSYGWDNLGILYRDGKAGVAVDLAKAMECFAHGVALGNSGSALNLGALYANGQGTQRDFVKAHAFYSLSDTDLARKNKAELEHFMRPEELAEAKALAAQLRADRGRFLASIGGDKDDDDDDKNPGGPGGVPLTFTRNADGSFAVKTAPPPDNDNDPFNDPPFSMIRPGDLLLEVDNKAVKGLTSEQLDVMLNGEAGSSVQLSLKRPGEDGGIQVAAPRVAKKTK